jgi:hypothetical protein
VLKAVLRFSRFISNMVGWLNAACVRSCKSNTSVGPLTCVSRTLEFRPMVGSMFRTMNGSRSGRCVGLSSTPVPPTTAINQIGKYSLLSAHGIPPQINVMQHVWLARVLVPRFKERGSGRFVITASAAGLLTQVGSLPYSVTKVPFMVCVDARVMGGPACHMLARSLQDHVWICVQYSTVLCLGFDVATIDGGCACGLRILPPHQPLTSFRVDGWVCVRARA